MKIKLIHIFLFIIILFLIFILIYFLTFYNNKFKNNSIINNTVENSISTNTRIDNTPQKIKIMNSDVRDDSPFICFVSDKFQIQEFENYFNNLLLDDVKSTNEFNPIYDITFYGNTNIIISLSKDKILQVTNESKNIMEYYAISNHTFNEILDLVNVKYYLHESKLELPASSTCTKAQNTILYGMSDSDIDNLREEIHNIHSSLEFHLADKVQTIKNANSFYWSSEVKDQIVIQPNGVAVQSYGFWNYRDSLKDISNLSLNDSTQKIVNDIIYKLEQGIDNHDISECFEAHKILHDLDYWIINYPINSFNIAPVDWGGIHCYYGSIENYKLD